MADRNRPVARKKTVSGGTGVHRSDKVVGGGPAGGGFHSGGGGKGVSRAAIGGGGIGLAAIIAILISVLGGGGGGVLPESGFTGGQSVTGGNTGTSYSASAAGEPDRTVAPGSREKYVPIKGGGSDKVTVMVYMCGTDLESKHGMASSDMQEMASANLGKNVDLLVFTGGCKQWKTSGISNTVDQIYKVEGGKLRLLEADMGSGAMTSPQTLTSFIDYCTKNYPSDRNELILWDHGGGSVSGYGYDEKNKSAGSMDLGGISKALKDSGVKFDLIGFDACLMSTAETALVLNDYADYMIASEETEPGIGWYYTNWLTALGSNTSMPTVDIGKNIVDDFIVACGRQCRGQSTTLSVVDLAEFSNTVPERLTAFSKSLTDLISNEEYKAVSDARYSTREFAVSSRIDQVDLADLALKMNNSEGKALADAVRGAVKYDRASSDMTNCYGVSIFFPYRRTSYVDKACGTYKTIGMDSEYTKAIRQFASIEASGQAATGGTNSPLGSLFDLGGSSGGADIAGQLLSAFLTGGSGRSVRGLDGSNSDFLSDMPYSEAQAESYITANYFDSSKLVWTKEADGRYSIELPEAQWELVHSVDLNMYYDDGTGYIDLGLDDLFELDGNKLIADTDRDWMSINGQPVAYYHTDTVDLGDGSYSISGYVPVLLNGERSKLILRFNSEEEGGEVVGVTTEYENGETDTIAKELTGLSDGDVIEFFADHYSYEGEYSTSYTIGTPITVNGDLTITNTDVGSGNVRILYRFTDIYEQEYWSEALII